MRHNPVCLRPAWLRAAAVTVCALAACTPDGVPDQQAAELEPSGLDSRPPNPTCFPPGSPPGTQWLDPFPDLPRFEEPVALRTISGDATAWYVAERAGRVRRFDNAASVARSELVLDITDRVAPVQDGGMLGLAFHPRFHADADKRFVFAFYTHQGGDGVVVSRLSRFSWPEGSAIADRDTEKILISVRQDQTLHLSDDLQFGPDGYLYASIGDGGPQEDSANHSQNPIDLRGKMWRIDVDTDVAGRGYGIPDGNPYKGRPEQGAEEVYAIGLRNPFRFSFDRQTGQLYAGDVGYDTWEEVNLIEAGKNYGWNCLEGAHRTPWTSGAAACAEIAPTPPIHEYNHDGSSASITGGRVYRGDRIPQLSGKYIFGDWATTNVWALDLETGERTELGASGLNVVDFAEAPDGELVAVDLTSGRFRRLSMAVGSEPPPVLSATGCFDPDVPGRPLPALIPFDVRAPLWSDGASKQRWMALPDGATIHVEQAGDREEDFSFPPGTVLIKEFSLPDGPRIETRFLVRFKNGDWSGYTYQWRPDQSDADLVPDQAGAHVVSWGDISWHYPSRGQCFACHSNAAGRALGPEIGQLNSAILYPATDRTANQLATLAHIGMFDREIGLPSWNLTALPMIVGPETAEERSRALLHSNCSPCHRPGGPGRGPADFRYGLALADMGICSVRPVISSLDIDDPYLLAPGAPERSIVLARMSRRGAGQMPPLATLLVDTRGRDLVQEWIQGLSPDLLASGCAIPATSLSVLNGAAYTPAVAADSLAAAFGTGLATTTEAAAEQTDPSLLPTQLGGTTVVVQALDGKPSVKARLVYVSPTQVNFVMPALGSEPPGPVRVTITAADGSVARGHITTTAVGPGLYAANGDGSGAASGEALRHDASGNLLAREPIAVLDGTGRRYVPRPIVRRDGDAGVTLALDATGLRHRSGLDGVEMWIDGVSAEVTSAGPRRDFVGIDRVSARIPAELFGRNEVDVWVTADGMTSNRLRVSLAAP